MLMPEHLGCGIVLFRNAVKVDQDIILPYIASTSNVPLNLSSITSTRIVRVAFIGVSAVVMIVTILPAIVPLSNSKEPFSPTIVPETNGSTETILTLLALVPNGVRMVTSQSPIMSNVF